MSKHTRGPWEAHIDRVYAKDPSSPQHLIVIADHLKPDNAALIAAAPDLLEALKDLVARYPLNVGMNAARAAIAKAEGSEQ